MTRPGDGRHDPHQPLSRIVPEHGTPDQEETRYRELVGRAEALTVLVSKAKRGADESLSRARRTTTA